MFKPQALIPTGERDVKFDMKVAESGEAIADPEGKGHRLQHGKRGERHESEATEKGVAG